MKVLFIRQGELGRLTAPTQYFPTTLAQYGHSVAMVGLAGSDSSGLVEAGVRVIEVGRKESWMGALRKACSALEPDIVHVFRRGGSDMYAMYPFIMRSHRRPRFVLDIRSPLLQTGVLRDLLRLKCRMEIVGYDAICTVDPEVGRSVIGNGRSMTCAPLGVDFSALPPLVHRESFGDPLRLVYAGTLHRKRRLERMVAAVASAAHNLSLSLDMYGEGDGKQKIMEVVEEHTASGWIRLHGAIPRDELFKRLAEYDIGLSYIPVDIYDAAPALKTLEYLACGLPVLATDTRGNRLWIRSEFNGLLVNESVEAFAEGICRMAEAPWIWTARKAARSSVEGYDWRRIVSNRLLPLYHSLLEA